MMMVMLLLLLMLPRLSSSLWWRGRPGRPAWCCDGLSGEFASCGGGARGGVDTSQLPADDSEGGAAARRRVLVSARAACDLCATGAVELSLGPLLLRRKGRTSRCGEALFAARGGCAGVGVGTLQRAGDEACRRARGSLQSRNRQAGRQHRRGRGHREPRVALSLRGAECCASDALREREE